MASKSCLTSNLIVPTIKTMPSRYILRKENFGGLIHDRVQMTTKAVDESEFNAIFKKRKDFDIIIRGNKESISLSAPLRVHLAVTRRCNLLCLHCLNESMKERVEELAYPDIFRWLTDLERMGVFELVITGGEPLCHPDFFRIIDLAKKAGFTIYLNTNGICPQVKLEALSRLGIPRIKISLDGLAETNDRLRGRGTFRKAVQTIQYLKKEQQNVRINFTLMRDNQHDLENMIQLANTLECDLKVAPLIPIGRGKVLVDQVLSAEKGKGLAKYISDYCAKNSIAIRVEIMSTFVSQSCKDTWEQFNYQFTDCGIRLTQLVVDSDGNVYPMGRLTDLQKGQALGNAYEESLDRLWEKAKVYNMAELCSDCASLDINAFLFRSFNSMRPF